MPGFSRALAVPYFVQPTGVTCQATCLKMFAAYLEKHVVYVSTGAGTRDILTIWKDINQDPKRPARAENAHANMKWWLEQHFTNLKFSYATMTDENQAVASMVECINAGFPVMVSVSHARVAGHIILVVGYENYIPSMCSPDVQLIVHDPYGRFDPSLLAATWGSRRLEGGRSLAAGGQEGPGQNNRIPVASAGRQREGDTRAGMYYLLSAHR